MLTSFVNGPQPRDVGRARPRLRRELVVRGYRQGLLREYRFLVKLPLFTEVIKRTKYKNGLKGGPQVL